MFWVTESQSSIRLGLFVVLLGATVMLFSCQSAKPQSLSPSLERAVLNLADYGQEYSVFQLNGDSGIKSNSDLGSIGGSTQDADGRIGAYFRGFDKPDSYPVFLLSSGLYQYQSKELAVNALTAIHSEYLELSGSDWRGSSVSTVNDVPLVGFGNDSFIIDLTLHDPAEPTHIFHQIRVVFQQDSLIGTVVAGRYDSPADFVAAVANWARLLRDRASSLSLETNTS